MVEVANLVVKIEKNKAGEIKTAHKPLTLTDKKTLESWPSQGLAQTSHAQFVEALRKEAYTMMIANLSKGVHPKDMDPVEVSGMVRHHLLDMIDKFTESAVSEAFQVLAESEEPDAVLD